MASGKNETSSKTLDLILESARYLFVTKGYFNTTIPDIVKDSGVSIGSIYHYFESKQHLACELYENTTKTCIQMLNDRIDKVNTLKDKMKSVVEHLYYLADNEQVRIHYVFFLNHNEINEPVKPAFPSKMYIVVQEMIDQGKKEGIFKNVQTDILASTFLGIPLYIIQQKVMKITDYPLLPKAEETFQMCWDAIIDKK
ncbi:TetR/AcrR family transcriptional regulator [Spirochaetota bacterium]